MRVQQSRTHVLPMTWEIPTTIAASWLFLAFLALPAGQVVAGWFHGGAWAWPQQELVTMVTDLLQGRAGPHAVTAYAVIAVLELVVTGIAFAATALWWRTYGPGTQYGLAKRHEVAATLGSGNLRRRRVVIRPDLVRRTDSRAEA